MASQELAHESACAHAKARALNPVRFEAHARPAPLSAEACARASVGGCSAYAARSSIHRPKAQSHHSQALRALMVMLWPSELVLLLTTPYPPYPPSLLPWSSSLPRAPLPSPPCPLPLRVLVASPLSWLGSCSGLHHSLDGADGVFHLPRDGAGAVVEHHVLVGRAGGPRPAELAVKRGGVTERTGHGPYLPDVPV